VKYEIKWLTVGIIAIIVLMMAGCAEIIPQEPQAKIEDSLESEERSTYDQWPSWGTGSGRLLMSASVKGASSRSISSTQATTGGTIDVTSASSWDKVGNKWWPSGWTRPSNIVEFNIWERPSGTGKVRVFSGDNIDNATIQFAGGISKTIVRKSNRREFFAVDLTSSELRTVLNAPPEEPSPPPVIEVEEPIAVDPPVVTEPVVVDPPVVIEPPVVVEDPDPPIVAELEPISDWITLRIARGAASETGVMEGDSFKVRVPVYDDRIAPYEGWCEVYWRDSHGYGDLVRLTPWGDITGNIETIRNTRNDDGRTVTVQITGCSLPEWTERGIYYTMDYTPVTYQVAHRPDELLGDSVTYSVGISNVTYNIVEGEEWDFQLNFDPATPVCGSTPGLDRQTYNYNCQTSWTTIVWIDITDSHWRPEANRNGPADDRYNPYCDADWLHTAYHHGCDSDRWHWRIHWDNEVNVFTWWTPNTSEIETDRTVTMRIASWARLPINRWTKAGNVYTPYYPPWETFVVSESQQEITINLIDSTVNDR
jgi:hypothetical protein